MGVVVLALSVGGFYASYLMTWEADQRWEEAIRDWYRPRMMLERWIRFRWIHPDSLYWIVHVRMDKGPIRLEGLPTDALYWSYTYYSSTEVNGSISSDNVVLEPDGSFVIHFSEDASNKNNVLVDPSHKRAVIYFRIYEPGALFPSKLPKVFQNGELLVERSDA